MSRRRRITPRCVWEDESGRRCRADGIGIPAYCRRHFELVRFEHPWEDEPLPLEEVLEHPFVKSLVERFRSYVEAVKPPPMPPQTPPEPAAGQAYQTDWPPRPTNGDGRHQNPPPSPPPPQRLDPRIVMGFGAKQALTVADVKKRQRELATLCHPDRGGDNEAMQRINAAVDALLSQLR